MKRCSGKIKYLYLILSNFSAPEIPQVLINRILYMFQDAEKIYDTEEVKPKRHKIFLSCNQVISGITCCKEGICHL